MGLGSIIKTVGSIAGMATGNPWISAGANMLGGALAGNSAKKGIDAASQAQAQAQAQQLEADRLNMIMQIINNRDNLNYQREYNLDQQGNRDEILGMQKQGYTDETQGMSTSYDPVKGWTTEYSDQAAALIDAQQKEDLYRSTVDALIARNDRVDNAQRRTTEGGYADNLMQQLMSGNEVDPRRIEADLTTSRRKGISEAFDRSQSNALRTAERTGTGGSELVARMARERAKAFEDVGAGAYTESLGIADNLNNSREAGLANLYNVMASRASNTNNVPVAPTTLPSSGAATGSSSKNSMFLLPDKTTPLNAGQAPRLNTQIAQPNYGEAYGHYAQGEQYSNIFKGIGNAIDSTRQRESTGGMF